MTGRFGSVALVVLFACSSAYGQEREWRFNAWDGPDFPVRQYVPQSVDEDTEIVIVMHGASRDAKRYFRDWKKQADEHNLIVVVPEFTKHRFRGSARYNLGYVFDPDTAKMRDEAQWTFSAIEPLFDAVVAQVNGRQSEYTLYGHSAGAQFVHRFMYYKPNARVKQFIAANAGWYTVPVYDFEYPYGLTKSNIGETALPSIFEKKLILLLGSEDRDPNGKSLRKTKEAQRQGPHRLARGLTMYRVGRATAKELGTPFNWSLFVVKDCSACEFADDANRGGTHQDVVRKVSNSAHKCSHWWVHSGV